MNDRRSRPATAEHRLATYGTLAPGRPNHHQLDGLTGRWLEGHVNGTLVEGPGYERVTTTVRTRAGDQEASIHILRAQDG